MWKQIAGWLAWFYTFGMAESNDPDPDDPDNAADPDDPDNEDDPDLNAEGGEDDPDDGGGGDSRPANIKALRQRAQADREARIAADARIAEQERQIRDLNARVSGNGGERETTPPADEDATQKFVREGSNVLKKNTEKIDRATFIALDAADKVDFYSQSGENPMIPKYRAKVEAELQRMMRDEKNRAPRHLILTYLIGKDAENAAIAKAKNPGRKTKDEIDAAERSREARKPGSPPRSDVRGNERKSERQKRIDRLAAQNI